ncbi:MAG TPA: glycine--tRNA ligase subunit beta [Rhizomicrobium sp.]|nr:glycine--tRNA ligase subunit beta [Rhizomicrobium sp.]
MADLLLELFSEEIPARMQAQAAKDLERLVVGALSDRGLLFEGAKAFAGPRRLTLAIAGLPAKQPDVSEELKGPKVDAPQAALDGFLRKTGLTKDQLKVEKTPKGDVYLAVIERAGRATAEVLAEILPECFAKLPWPKSMRWPQGGEHTVSFSDGSVFSDGSRIKGPSVRWVRPLHGIVCTFDGEVVPFEFAGVTSGDTTRGHRFLSSGAIEVRRYDDYVEKLHKAHVILDAEERKAIIFEAVKSAAFVHGLEMIPDEGLLDEVAGLAEWPVVLIGAIQDEFMDVPPEILQTSMRTHQKYFSLRDPKTGKMANRFALVANMIADDAGREIVAGNERVLRARLSDAKFFWDQDRKRSLESRVDDLKNIVFHAKLGTQFERVERIVALAGEIAARIGADVEKAKRAALLCKADLTTGVVGEFPELQGVMGRYYALHDGDDAEVADAVREHYKPVGPSDAVPANKVSIAVSLADKVDQIVGFFAIDERPTGSGDPYALRRAALGSTRTILTEDIRFPLTRLFGFGLDQYLVQASRLGASHLVRDAFNVAAQRSIDKGTRENWNFFREEGVAEFLNDRMKVVLRTKGTWHDLIDAVFSLGNEDDLVRLVARVEALQSFLKTDEGANLLAGYKRAANILKAEEKKDKMTFDGEPDAGLFVLPEEKALGEALASASKSIADDVAAEKFVEAMGVMAKLRAPVDAFFDKVTVNDKDAKLRENRLKLLARLRATLHQVADFSKIEG